MTEKNKVFDSDSTEGQSFSKNYRHYYKETKISAKSLPLSSPLGCSNRRMGCRNCTWRIRSDQIGRKESCSQNCKIMKKASPPSASNGGGAAATAVGVRTSTKQSMDYITINGIAQRINYTVDKFPEWILNELMINAIDFLNSNYYSKPNTRMVVWVNLKREQNLLRIRVRNSNDLNINPFPSDLYAIFDLTRFDSTKRHQRGISGGALGDALKEILAIPYALISSTDDGASFTRKQWEEPFIIRFCGQEYHTYIHVNKADDNNPISVRVDGPYTIAKGSDDDDGISYIELQVAIPIIPAILRNRRIGLSSLVSDLERQYKKYFLTRSRRMEFHFNGGGE